MAEGGFAVGYNVSKTNKLMEDIKKAYEDMKLYITDEWPTLLNVLHTEWVGEDEQDFEDKLAQKICNLYENAYNLAQNSITTVYGLANSWYEFQKNNTLEGAESSGRTGGLFGIGGNRFGLDEVKISHNDKIVEKQLVQLTNDMDRGLANSDSARKIQSAVTDFVNTTKKKTEDLFNEIQVNQAFFGEQTRNIKIYIDKTGAAVGEVTVALKDMYSALETLAGSSYTKASEDVSAQFQQSTNDIESSLNELGSSRWS